MMVETDNDVVIRSANPSDAGAIARVHLTSWRSAYAHVLPSDYLDSLDVDEQTRTWEKSLGQENSTTVVAEADGRTLGFASWGPSRDEDAEDGCLELYAIYLDPESWGRGVARDLMRTMLGEVGPQARITLWVLSENARAHHFYRRHGFQPDGIERMEDYADVPVTEVRFVREPER
ncbi:MULTISPECIES: GNAT family N-acetyltransferase [unclassified Isoptericola]|uniref:GNAT family N-acetyltransferase n=1 Tax=unclassified Isoptericola TaxID=2623355 RepID=UPI002712A62D|nr:MULTISPECIES: GNAT family N-acetyltransferase [unclassified Isoptericola]MDO8145452.1 GNAT family N-acetyltransferase [Isoptericola sp. 178]MDO8149093.1 GNAT family N-acetyltransferase [Isoptericola sp. b515]MDO8150967.1 GNAT family N-acetyltransferase [Isoptericola sp. b408]